MARSYTNLISFYRLKWIIFKIVFLMSNTYIFIGVNKIICAFFTRKKNCDNFTNSIPPTEPNLISLRVFIVSVLCHCLVNLTCLQDFLLGLFWFLLWNHFPLYRFQTRNNQNLKSEKCEGKKCTLRSPIKNIFFKRNCYLHK